MTDYFQEDIQVCCNFSDHNELLAKFGEVGASTLSPYYDARIINNYRKPQNIQLIIFYSQAEFLFEKLEFLQENGINILQCITSRPAQKTWDFPTILDFTNSRLISIEESHFWEHKKKPLIITTNNIDLLIQNRHIGDGMFQLTENALQHIYEYIQYGFLANSDPNDKFISSNKNKEISFGSLQMKLSFNHDYGKDTKYTFEINRDAYLTVMDTSEVLTDIEILEIGSILCTLMSFYWQKTIDFFIAHVRVNNYPNYNTRIKYKYSNNYTDESLEYSLKERYDTIYEFIESLNYTKVLKSISLLQEIVPRIIKTKIVDEISEFMLLYNVIEKIRNFCIESPLDDNPLEIRDEFNFIGSKTATYKFINAKIKEIAEIVDPRDIDDFLAKVNGKVSFIKKTGLIDQFDSLVSYLGLTPESYNLDFPNLITIRSDIYHGNPPQEDVKPYNIKMRSLIDDLILKLLC